MNNIVAEKKWITQNLGNVNPLIKYPNLSQGYLRAETALATQSVIKFKLQKNQVQTPLATERLLNLNDLFVVTNFTVGLKQIASDTSTDTLQLNAIVHTWENPQVFSGTNSVNVASIYNSSFEWTINRKVFIPGFPMRAFRRVPTSQKNLQAKSTGTATTPTSTYFAAGADGYDNGLYGFYPCEPTVLDGRETQDIEINLNASLAMDDSSLINYAVLELRGYLVTNAKD